MILIFGRYNRTVNLPPTPGHCPACRTHASIFWHRHYKTGHFFFFPLFSFSEQHQAALEAQLITGAAYGGSEEEKTLASKVFSSMQKDEGLPQRMSASPFASSWARRSAWSSSSRSPR